MKNISFLSLLIGICLQVFAQNPTVPSKMEFAGMTLEINKAAQKKIQEEVDNLRKNPTYFQKYVDQADIFFPVIEKVFEEEKFPDEIKYLVIQESAFRAEAVSSSNAVGYWQFKKETGLEVGLKIDGKIDERKNIEKASRGAATYMKKNNVKLNNWVHALTSYNTGLGGVQKFVDNGDIGAKKMEITGRTHWYFVTFLAHKIAFEKEVGKKKPSISLLVDKNQGGKKLKQIAKDYDITYDDLLIYNKWIDENHKIPTDGEYSVIVPVGYNGQLLANSKKKNPSKSGKIDKSENEYVEVNGVEGMIAVAGDNAARMAIKAGITRKQFLVYNEMESFEEVEVGKIYYIHAKRTKAEVPKHTVQEGETLKEIAQKYAIKERSIRSKNRMRSNEALMTGRVLWLREKRDKDAPIEFDKSTSKNAEVKTTKKTKTTDKVTEINENEVIDEIEEPQTTKKETVTPQKETTKVVREEKIAPSKLEKGEQQEELSQKTTVTEKSDKLVINVTQQGQGKKQNANSILHEVKQGETLYSISKLYQVTVSEIVEWNNLSNPSLALGQKLVINVQKPAEKTVQKEVKYVYHIVQQGETIYKISTQYKITPAQIMEWNKKTEPTLAIGEKLIVKIIEE